MEPTRTKLHRNPVSTFVLILSLIASAVPSLRSEGEGRKTQSPEINNSYQIADINNVFSFYSNNGDGSYNIFTATSGFEWPKGSNHTAIFEDGLLFGGILSKDGRLYVDGSTYFHCWQAGRIITPGGPGGPAVAASADDPHYRVYRVRPDVNPNTPLDANLQAVLQNENVLIARFDPTSTVQKIYNQYIADWNEWPADEGAPYLDVNGDGKYDPKIDIPGIPDADQTLWHVSNDMSKTLDNATYGSDPVGIEMQRTIWAYNRPGPLGNTIFTKYRLINKSGYEMNGTYLTAWSDPDLGDAGDDFIGCDTTLSLGFVYNGEPNDRMYGSQPPAAGYDFLQGPIVPSPTDTAIFNFKRRAGYKNLPMSSFNFFINGNALYTDPVSIIYFGATEWYNLMQGLISTTGAPIVDPHTLKPTKFPFSGDPVTAQDWLDGSVVVGGVVQNIPPGDRRMAMSCGPFTFAAGDTQEVVVAAIASQGRSNILSISELRKDDKFVQLSYDNFFQISPPYVNTNTRYNGGMAYVRINADARGSGVKSLSASLRYYDGTLVNNSQLFDDGLHGDGSAGDGIYSNEIALSPAAKGMYLDLGLVTTNDVSATLPRVVEDITTLGGVNINSPVIASDNLNNDGIANSGENVRVTVSATNYSPFDISHFTLYGGDPWASALIGPIAAQSVVAMKYSPFDPNSYLSFTMPSVQEDTTIVFQIFMGDDNHNSWTDSIAVPVHPMTKQIAKSPVSHLSGKSDGNFAISVVDQANVLAHRYVISGTDSLLVNPFDSSWVPLFSLSDSTENHTLLEYQPLPDTLGHNSVVVDGFKVLRGSIITSPSFKDYIPLNVERWEGKTDDTLSLEGFGGTIGNGIDHWYTSSTVPHARLREVTIKLAATDSNGNFDSNDGKVSFAYRYLFNADKRTQPGFSQYIINKEAGLPFQDFTKSVPFSVYDVDADPPRRLAIGFTENNMRFGSVNGRYWPPVYDVNSAFGNNTGMSGPREWYFIFDANYSESLDSSLAVNLTTRKAPIMWIGIPARAENVGWNGTEQSTIEIYHSISSKDRWTFDPTVILRAAEKNGDFPRTFRLMQNYPNPFNPSTTICYTLPVASRTSLIIFNILGQEIKRLVETAEPPGDKMVVWDGKNDLNTQVASGVYFYRMEAASVASPNRSYSVVRKMILLR